MICNDLIMKSLQLGMICNDLIMKSLQLGMICIDLIMKFLFVAEEAELNRKLQHDRNERFQNVCVEEGGVVL